MLRAVSQRPFIGPEHHLFSGVRQTGAHMSSVLISLCSPGATLHFYQQRLKTNQITKLSLRGTPFFLPLCPALSVSWWASVGSASSISESVPPALALAGFSRSEVDLLSWISIYQRLFSHLVVEMYYSAVKEKLNKPLPQHLQETIGNISLHCILDYLCTRQDRRQIQHCVQLPSFYMDIFHACLQQSVANFWKTVVNTAVD